MNIYFVIHNQDEGNFLKNEIMHSTIKFEEILDSTKEELCIKTSDFPGPEIEYFSQCFSLKRITDS